MILRLFDLNSKVNCGTTYRDGEHCGRSRLRGCGKVKSGFGHVKCEYPTGVSGEMIHRQLVVCV